MAVALSLILIGAGAVLAATVRETTGLGLNVVGYILMIVGVVGLAASLAATRSGDGPSQGA
jgi:hypothetical protein